MPANKRHKTDYVGVYYILTPSPVDGKQEKMYYIRYKLDGVDYEEKVGSWKRGGITPAKASHIRADKMTGKSLPKAIQRKIDRESTCHTLDDLFNEFKEGKKNLKSLDTDIYRYDKHLSPFFGGKAINDISLGEVTKLKNNLSASLKPQTIKHVLNLLRRVINYGSSVGLCDPIGFKMPNQKVDNTKTEYLTEEELKRLFGVLEKDKNKIAVAVIKLALFTGMRRGEIFRLRWDDIDFVRGFIFIRGPKGGKGQSIPMNTTAKETLENVERIPGSKLVFPGKNGNIRTDMRYPIRRIRKEAKISSDFRPLHGLRHTYASNLASSGEVDLYTLQKLLTHKSPLMTQRYAHLRDEALKKAADVADDLFKKNK